MPIAAVGAIAQALPVVSKEIKNLLSGGTAKAKYSPVLSLADVTWIFQNATAEQLQWLAARWAEVPRKTALPFPTGNAAAFYQEYSGGSDHVVSTQAGEALAKNTESLFNTMKTGQQQGTTPTNPVGPALPGVKSTIGDILDNLKGAVRNVLGSTLAGAAEGAKNASQGAETGSGVGAALSNTKATLSIIVVIVIVAVVLWFIVKKR